MRLQGRYYFKDQYSCRVLETYKGPSEPMNRSSDAERRYQRQGGVKYYGKQYNIHACETKGFII